MRAREAVLYELATEQVKLAELERELSTARGRIDALNAELQTTPIVKPTLPLTTAVVSNAPATPAGKVKLFRSLFFLVVDFDKGSWKEDVTSFAETSRSLEIPVAIERSRSGNSAHAWFFFASPVSANIVRRMG
jgi:hypothetical protein